MSENELSENEWKWVSVSERIERIERNELNELNEWILRNEMNKWSDIVRWCRK